MDTLINVQIKLQLGDDYMNINISSGDTPFIIYYVYDSISIRTRGSLFMCKISISKPNTEIMQLLIITKFICRKSEIKLNCKPIV